MDKMERSLANLDFTSDFIENEENIGPTPMKEYFNGKTVFLTGGTGFLGQLFIEKLLRAEIKELYLLMRPKKGKSPKERLDIIFSDVLFGKLAKKDPKFIDRIRIIEGNLCDVKLGLSESDLNDIYENVDILIHAGADVKFDESLLKLVLINVRGTRELLKICEKIKQLQVFAYISTAYSHCYQQNIDEKFYDPPVKPEDMIKFIEKNIDNQKVDWLQERIITPFPNTYTYTKALSEDVVRKFGQKIPICVIRPSIVISTHEDPIPAWCNNIYGLNGVLVACGMGVLRLMPLNKRLNGDIICADFVINTALAAVWYTHTKQNLLSLDPVVKTKQISDPEVYHITASPERAVTWGQISDQMKDMADKYPTINMLWKHCPNSSICPFMKFILTFYYHVIPAVLFDAYFVLKKEKLRLLPVYRKVQRFLVALRYFMTKEWNFSNTNMKRLLAAMTPGDQEFFPCDSKRFNWIDFSYYYMLGLKVYIAKESNDHVERARKKRAKIVILHNIILIFYYSFNGMILYHIAKYFGLFNYMSNTVINTYEFLKDPSKF